MRRLFVPVLMAAVLGFTPIGAKANTNQASAEKIAASLAERFPGYDISVSYLNGKVRLVGQVASPDMSTRVLEQVQRVPGVKVTDIENGLQVASSGMAKNSPVTAQPTFVPRPALHTPLTMQQAAQPSAARPAVDADVAQVSAHHNPQQHVQNAAAYARITQPYHAYHGDPAHGPQAHGQQAHGQPAPLPLGAGPQYPMPSRFDQQLNQQQALQQQYMQQMMQQQAQQPPMPGQYNQPNMPAYAWPSYAAYPNYAEVCYPKQYSPKAWPYIGPFYPYPQAPLGWRQITLEWHDGWWWLDFDDGSCEGPFSPLFRQSSRYAY